MEKQFRLAVLATHPVHYQVQFFRAVARHPEIDLLVFFGSDFGLKERVDPTFGRSVRWYDESLLAGLQYRFLKNYPLGRSASSFWNPLSPGIYGELRRGRFDALWIHGYASSSSYLAYLAARRTGTPVLFRGETVLRPGAPAWRERLKSFWLRRFLSGVAAVLPIGAGSREFYRHYGVPEDRMFLTPYAVDNQALVAQADALQPERRELRRKLGFGESPVVLVTGKLIRRKRPLDLLEAWERVGRGATLALAGDGPLAASLQAYVRDRNLEGVIFLGFRPPHELPGIYAAADIFCLPSEFEPWGLVVNEAMCFGLPVVTTTGVAAARDLVGNGENGFVVPPGDVNALAEALALLLGDRERRLAMGLCSRQIIAGWNFDRGVEAIVAALRKISAEAKMRDGRASLDAPASKVSRGEG